ncbi:ribulokinase [Lewinella sp. W8]|uniref:ribulokinase n=1 Tax=Lewinella sp. W8 TaxID=2528208 RepID=UPI0010688D4C|nr:ribulokinase [Lewinella sp. W8]MTB50429.1 ribulokinase [Lewinella sp. W8]
MKYTLGLDFGTDSVRALLVDVSSGQEVGTGVSYYPRWKAGKYCQASLSQFRQHPQDYVDGLVAAVKAALADAPAGTADEVVGIAVDTTGSTPVAVDASGTPLALREEFRDNPNAMFVLWKDHTAIQEAEEINNLCRNWETDYTKYEGGIYSSEWFWAKILHVLRTDEGLRAAAHSWVEHCDWIPFLLTGGKDIKQMLRSRCAAGHKALWHPEWGGLPPEEFLTELDPLLAGLRDRLYVDTHTSDVVAGLLSDDWAGRLGLPAGIPVSVGAFDAHMGAVGGEIKPFYLSRVMGTSTCDILVIPDDHPAAKKLVRGICGQVDGSVIPQMLGLEAGQSAFGDVLAWFTDLLSWGRPEASKGALIAELSRAAADLPPGGEEIAVDWFNGRRTPDANQRLRGAIAGLNLGSDAPRVFRALVEAICFGARHIVSRFESEEIPVEGIIGLGGVAKKNPFVMQTLANVLNRPIQVARSEQTCALGAAMFAAVAAGVHPDVPAAVSAMGSGFDATYHPEPDRVKYYEEKYTRYRQLGAAAEQLAASGD